MSSLRYQVIGIIDACKTALARGKDLPPVAATTAQIASAILKQAKAELPNDKVLSSWSLYQVARGQAFYRLWKQLTIRFQFPVLLVGLLVAAEAVAAPKIFEEKVAGL